VSWQIRDCERAARSDMTREKRRLDGRLRRPTQEVRMHHGAPEKQKLVVAADRVKELARAADLGFYDDLDEMRPPNAPR
jgi:hypothetical protein